MPLSDNTVKGHHDPPPAKWYVFPLTLLALAMFIPLFVLRQIGVLDFFWWMSLSMVVILTLALALDRSYRQTLPEDVSHKIIRKIVTGLISAGILYMVFLAGNFFVRHVMAHSGQQISDVYSFKGQASPLRIILLMAFIIGPGEELFWRGFLQGNLMARFGRIQGLIMATMIYSLMHLASGNILLVMAAFVCGLFWGWLYLRYRSMVVNVVSHTVWDIVVFMVIPFTS
jgi:membrane protease YdiL (CAAX protease family)